MDYIGIQKEVIEKYDITLCNGTMNDGNTCPHAWRRTHSCNMARKIYKWNFKNSIEATLNLFHEIGHQEMRTGRMRRCESEYYATVWAIDKLKEYGILNRVPEKQKELYQNYIYTELDRGLRRGGKNYPTKQTLALDWQRDNI